MSILYNFFKQKMINELKAQGHTMTGRLINSFREDNSKNKDGYTIKIFMDDYGLVINRRYNPFTGKKSKKQFSEYVKGILRFAGERGLSERIAWKIINKSRQAGGHPLRGSYKYSSNGYRIRWIDRSVESAKRFTLGEDFLAVDPKATTGFKALESQLRRNFERWFGKG